jgi:hypothetical protein
MILKLLDLIDMAGVKLDHFKIHFATGGKPTPLEAFYAGDFKKWQEYQNRQNFQCRQVLSLIHMGGDKWLFAGMFKIDGVIKRSNEWKSWYEYSTTEIGGLEHLTGKAIIGFKRTFRASYVTGDKYGPSLAVSEIRPERVSIAEFPGYNRVSLSLHVLRTIIRQDLPGWKTALSNVAGIYLIADVETGKQYVGSAYGNQGLWQRWYKYGESGHGGNKELRDLLAEKGSDYAMNFLFTILEVIDVNASQDYVIAREGHWKDVLLSRRFGYNSN